MLPHRQLYTAIGGRPTLDRVHKRFYDALFEHEWLSGFFVDIVQEDIEASQSDFMSGIMGGPKDFVGQFPQTAHKHMFITDEMLELRSGMLDQAMREEGVSDEARESWLDLDSSFRNAIVKKSEAECEKRYVFEAIIVVPRPLRRAG